jgi:hypothetical protein
MTESERNWLDDAEDNGWLMPSAPKWKRLPVVRHIRAMYHSWRVSRHQQMWTAATGALHSGYDRWVIYGMARGWETDQ